MLLRFLRQWLSRRAPRTTRAARNGISWTTPPICGCRCTPGACRTHRNGRGAHTRAVTGRALGRSNDRRGRSLPSQGAGAVRPTSQTFSLVRGPPSRTARRSSGRRKRLALRHCLHQRRRVDRSGDPHPTVNRKLDPDHAGSLGYGWQRRRFGRWCDCNRIGTGGACVCPNPPIYQANNETVIRKPRTQSKTVRSMVALVHRCGPHKLRSRSARKTLL